MDELKWRTVYGIVRLVVVGLVIIILGTTALYHAKQLGMAKLGYTQVVLPGTTMPRWVKE